MNKVKKVKVMIMMIVISKNINNIYTSVLSRAEISRVLFNRLFGPHLHTSLKKIRIKRKKRKNQIKKNGLRSCSKTLTTRLKIGKGKAPGELLGDQEM